MFRIPNRKSWGPEIFRECCHMSCVRCQVSGGTCQMSRVMCHVSGVMSQVSHVSFKKKKTFLYKVVELVGGGSVINGAYPV